MRRAAAIVLGALILLGATACGQTHEQYIKERAAAVKACQESGGEWYNRDPGWTDEGCHFDTREDRK